MFSDNEQPTLRVTDGLDHDLPGTTAEIRRKMLDWLNLEEAVGELSPGLRDLRDGLRADEAAE